MVEGVAGFGAAPYASGGGGAVLELLYGAVLLSGLLAGDPVTELGDDATPLSVRFQAGLQSPVDDLVVSGVARDGQARQVSVGVRRAPRLVKSDNGTARLLAGYVQVVAGNWADVAAGRCRLCLAVAVRSPAVAQLRELTVIARAAADDTEFRAEVRRPGRLGKGVRDRLAHVDALVASAAEIAGSAVAGVPAGTLTWRLLCSLQVRVLRLEGGDAADRTHAVSRLMPLTPEGTAAAGDALFARIAEFAGRYASTGAEVDAAQLRADLGMPLAQPQSAAQPMPAGAEPAGYRLETGPPASVGDPSDALRAFISHTSELREFPRGGSYIGEAERAVAASGHVIVNMADFPASSLPPADLCADRVRSCDVYVGVLGLRYGSLVPGREESYTELEFDVASTTGIPRLMFLLDPDAEASGIPPSRLTGPHWERQEEFRRRVSEDSGLTVQYFRSPDHLRMLVERSLRDLTRSVGGARSDGPTAAVIRGVGLPGRLLDEVRDPFELEVHQSAHADGPTSGLPVLPTYLQRDHDRQLREVVLGAAEGASGISVLVGGSSTGKTRACWEALDLLRGQPGWRLWHPIAPSRPQAVLHELSRIGPRTVVWLNEAQLYLTDGRTGEQVAAGLRELLRDPGRSPVLVLATLWPQNWTDLTVRPAAGEPDLHPQAHELLSGHAISVPDALTPNQVAKLAASADPRLAEAAMAAEDGKAIQFLAGAPLLIARYENAPLAARALLDAAIDARRMGMAGALSRDFLAAAVPGYMADADWDALDGDWLSDALAWTAAPLKGIRGPLVPIRPAPGRDPVHRATYRLADYLERQGSRIRGSHLPPESFWRSVARFADPADLAILTETARSSLVPGEWLEPGEDPLPAGEITPLPAFEYAASGDLDSYAREFDKSPRHHTALSAGRLPFPPELADRSRDLADLVTRIWRITSPDSPMFNQLLNTDEQPRDVLQQKDAADEAEDDPPQPLRYAHSQEQGDWLERATRSIMERLCHIEPDTWEVEVDPRAEVRRQPAGTQDGADIVIRFKFKTAALGPSSTCLVECKNYTNDPAKPKRLPLSAVADKLLQARSNWEAEPVDHWILISPHLDPGRDLDRQVAQWNRDPLGNKFTLQVWCPQTGVEDLFAIEPETYRSLYGKEPEQRPDVAGIIKRFSKRLEPPVRLPERLQKYVLESTFAPDEGEQDWPKQLDMQIKRFGFDEKGARLSRPAEDEIISVLIDSPKGSNVVLLLAEFGEGKSFLTVSLCHRLRDRYLQGPRSGSPIPIRLRLRSYRAVSAAADFLRYEIESYVGLSLHEFRELRNRNILVILDGLDEMSVRQDPDTMHDNLKKIGSLLGELEGIPVLVTSRPHFFAAGNDRELLYDRLRDPHVFKMERADPLDVLDHLRKYADSRGLGPKLNKLKELYNPIGLAGKVLFLEMLKETLDELPLDHFDALILYDTYVQKSLSRKIDLLDDPESAVTKARLLDGLEKLLEKIAVDIQVSGEGGVDLRKFTDQDRHAAQLLWNASQPYQSTKDIEDASARIGGRSLLRRVGPEDDKRWLVDFFHRSMKEYFVAKALRRALSPGKPDAVTATKELLVKAPVQPEILGFFRLLAREDQPDLAVLKDLTCSAQVGSGSGSLGGGAISLYHAAGGQLTGSKCSEWRSLQLDGALLSGADLSGSNFQGSWLRVADLSSANLTGTDLSGANLTGATLDAGASIVGLAPDAAGHRFLYLTKDCEQGWITIQDDGSLLFSVMALPRTLHWPESVHLLREDIALVAARSEFLIVDISGGTAKEVAYFRVSDALRCAGVINQELLGFILEDEHTGSEALLIDIKSGQVLWRVPVEPGGGACGWYAGGVVTAPGLRPILFTEEGSREIAQEDLKAPLTVICMNGDQAVLVTELGDETWLPLNNTTDPACVAAVHQGPGTAAAAVNGQVLSVGTDGTVTLTKRDGNATPVIITSADRRLRCIGAQIEGLESDRERDILIKYGAS